MSICFEARNELARVVFDGEFYNIFINDCEDPERQACVPLDVSEMLALLEVLGWINEAQKLQTEGH